MILLWLAGILAGVALIVLLTPVRIDLDLTVPDEAEPGPMARVRLRWAFVSWTSGRRPARAPAPKPPPQTTQPVEKRASGTAGLRTAVAMLRTPGFLRRCGRAVSGAGRAVAPVAVTVRARVGLDDPAATGMLMGALATLNAMPQPAGWDIRVAPEFTEPAFAGRAHVRWSVTPASVLWPVVALMCAPVTWRAVRAAWRVRRARPNAASPMTRAGSRAFLPSSRG